MKTEDLEESQIDLLIMSEEFRFWDASRNNVPEQELAEITMEIKRLKIKRLGIIKNIKGVSLNQ